MPVRTVEARIAETGERFRVVTIASRRLDVGAESIRNWVKWAELDKVGEHGLATDERQRLVELERKNCELRRANEILDERFGFFVAELDGRCPR